MPSYRTLCERVEKAQFEPGIQNNVLEWLKVKVDTFGNSESKDCVIALDEMQLQPTIEFDRGKMFSHHRFPVMKAVFRRNILNLIVVPDR